MSGVTKIRYLKMIMIIAFVIGALVVKSWTNRGRDIKTSKPACLYTSSPMQSDEMNLTVHRDIQQVCPGDYGGIKVWRLNFNEPRTYTFRQVTSTDSNRLPLWFHFSMAKERKQKLIPHILHFIWNDQIIPGVFVENLKLFRKQHPPWAIHFWTLKAGRDFIQTFEPQLLKVYDNEKIKAVSRADILRYVVVYYMGGAYFDLDSKSLRPLDELTYRHECLVGPEPKENAVVVLKMRSLLANSGFMCRPRHPFFRHVIDQIVFYGTLDPGPSYFTKVFNLFIGNHLGSNSSTTLEITVAPHDYFEYHLNKGVDLALKTICATYYTHIQNYPRSCLQPGVGKSEPTCAELHAYEAKLGGNAHEYEACLEWISHDKEKRTPEADTIRFIAHEHYGTYVRPKSLDHKKYNNISLIVSDVILHI